MRPPSPVVEMTTYNETLLSCGKPEPFKSLLVMSNHTMAAMVKDLSNSQKSLGLFGLLGGDSIETIYYGKSQG